MVDTKPSDWETTDVDLTGFIRYVNGVKSQYPVFQEESITEVLGHDNPAIVVMWKAATRAKGEALIILNKDPWNWQVFRTDDLYRLVQSAAPLKDVSPEWAMDHVPSPFEFELHPGMGRVLVSV